ncbi:O-methyltransferase [Diaminobutyricibacter tongyongensis]|uniref:O-methyltransferase n=1 Tax=Leifsonia tongyongensis TaxID=1268043 RepID=A0A6L9XXA2_9MICO|nr:O-methyltransferase [Diaminobutyricibacter tongyongensis]NEN05875.1 O-methyltransferase [Diaminobutyricibacter tongyongensis]
MADSQSQWDDVDRYLIDTLVGEDAALAAARASSRDTTAPGIEVTANQGRLLGMLVELIGAKRVLEFGTLAGYSMIWMARATGEGGVVTSLELEEQNAAIARANAERAGVGDRVDVIVGPARASAQALVDAGVEPYDFVFIDADKQSTPEYLRLVLEVTHPGSVIVIDNVVREGSTADADSTDEQVRGMRTALADIAANPALEATALQTVGLKGWDGFAIIRRVS